MLVQKLIEETLAASFDVKHLEVLNESHMHSVPPNSETHFKVILVSSDFDGVRKVARHQQIYKVLEDAMKNGIHALALHLYNEEEWEAKTEGAPVSPNCMGGSKGDNL